MINYLINVRSEDKLSLIIIAFLIIGAIIMGFLVCFFIKNNIKKKYKKMSNRDK